NTYTGQTNINAGIVQITTASALGVPTGNAVVASGATLQLNPGAATTFLSKQILLSGQGMGLTQSTLLMGTGALQNIANFASPWTGNISLNSSDASLSSTQNTVTISGAISGTGGLAKLGAGTIVIAAPDAHTGATTIVVGTLTVNGVGQILNTSGITEKVNASLTLDNTGTNLTGRLGAAPLTLNNATLTFLGNNTPGVLTTETLASVTLNSGSSFINPTSDTGLNAAASLTIGTLNRTTGSTVAFVPGGSVGITGSLNSAFNKILINTPGTGVTTFGTGGAANGNTTFNSNILPWATVSTLGGLSAQYDFLTFNGTSVAAYTNYKTSIAAAGATDIVRLTANETMTANKVVGAVLYAGTTGGAGTGTITQNNFTLGVASGAVLSEGNNTLTLNGGTVDFGSAEGILGQNNANIAVNSSLTGTGGLTIVDTQGGGLT